MTRAELYEEIFKAILSNHADTFENVIDIQSEFDLNGLSNALTMALDDNGINNHNFQRLANNLLRKLNDEEITDYGNLIVSKAVYQKLPNKRDFIWHSQEFTVINCCQLFQDNSDYSDELLMGIEQICYVEANRDVFLDYLKTNTDEGCSDYYVIYDTDKFPHGEDWKLYMYGLNLYLNTGTTFPLNEELIYTPSIHTEINYNNDAQYIQYIDIYDVIGEWNKCSDVLSAFLKMYQVLEYIVYRRELVAIIQESNVKQSFIRQIKGIDRKYSNNEREAFKGVFKILKTFKGELQKKDITEEMALFCKKYYAVNDKGNPYLTTKLYSQDVDTVNNGIAKFIYDTRCAIVHNKEAEFHITYFNYDEYKCIVPLMKKVLIGIRNRVIELLNDPNNVIIFPKPVMEWY